MKFTILSHASFYIEQDDAALLVDPWLRGSAYWRSWWNFPPVNNELVESLRPTHIFITHIHWDHYHGPSLRLFSKDIPILIPEDRYDRMTRDLHAMGFKNVRPVPHAREVKLGRSLSIRPYLFLPMTDTALMIYSPQVTLLDANDCKIAGAPLSQLLRDFPRIDFAFRSHSSANSRVCHQYLDRANASKDDREQYVRSFCNFMRAVQPRYAVPFASNHCHLHRDAIQFNDFIQTPLDVASYFDKVRARERLRTELKVMLPGSSWSEQGGFELVDTKVFEERDVELQRYAQANRDKLEKYYATEAKVNVTTENMRAFFDPFLASLPWFVRRMFRGRPMVVVSEGGAAPSQWRIDLSAGTVEPVDEGARSTAPARMHIPAMVLRQSLRMNMFGHAAISKRVFYRATEAWMPYLNRFESLLRAYELEFLPLRRNFSWPTFKTYALRWREVLLYGQVAVRMALGQKPVDIEQRLLLRAGARRTSSTQQHEASGNNASLTP